MSESVHAVVAKQPSPSSSSAAANSNANAQSLHNQQQQHLQQFRHQHQATPPAAAAAAAAAARASNHSFHPRETIEAVPKQREKENEKDEEKVEEEVVVDEDDDIDIIGKFGGSDSGGSTSSCLLALNPPLANPLSFMSAASTSLNAASSSNSSYLLQANASAGSSNNFSNLTFHPNPNYHPHITHPHHPQFHHPHNHHPHIPQQQQQFTTSTQSALSPANFTSSSSSASHYHHHHHQHQQQLTPTNSSSAGNQQLENSGNSSDSVFAGVSGALSNQDAVAKKRGSRHGGDHHHNDESGGHHPFHHHPQQHRQQQQQSRVSSNQTGGDGTGGGDSNTSTTTTTTSTATTTTTTGHSEWATDAHFTPARDRLRRALRYYFMSPIDKWRIKGRFPWKLLLQVVKIILVTTQLVLFGNNVTQYRAADSSMLVSLHNLLLLNWDTARDFKVVPPDSGPYAVYTKEDVYRHIDYAIRNYANISALTVGAFGYQLARDKQGGRTTNSTKMNSSFSSKLSLSPRPDRMSTISVCYHRYANATLNPSLGEYFIDAAISERCLDLVADSPDLPPPGSPAWANFSYLEYLNRRAPELVDDFEALLQCTVKLPLRTILLNTIVAFNTPQCFDLDVALNFDNRAHSGEIKVNMVAHNRQIDCRGNLEDHSRETHSHNVHISVNVVVLVLCSLSLVLCIRSLWRGQALRRRTVRFFALAYRRHLESASSLHFIDGWILMILLNDLLLLTGTAINLLRQLYLIGPHSHFSLRPIDFDNICSALLGVGNLLVWCGLLRYLAFFSRYNLLIVTLKHALSRVLRFLLCVLILYGGFCFSGWIILGPYHWKFRTLARTSECLFALMNGDDVFATFAYLQSGGGGGGGTTFVWWFSRLYLYSFVLLFIYVVLSLFIAILMDSYETIKEFYRSRSEKARKGNGGAKSSLLFSNDQLARFIAADQGDDGQGMMGSGESGGGGGGGGLGVTSNEHHHLDWTTSYRISLLHDEEMEFQQSQQSSTAARRRMLEASADQTDGVGSGNGSGNTGEANGGCHCCICHFLQALLAPLSCFRTAFTSLRSKLGARTAAAGGGGGGGRRRLDEDDDDDNDEGDEDGNDDSSTNADESATLRIN